MSRRWTKSGWVTEEEWTRLVKEAHEFQERQRAELTEALAKGEFAMPDELVLRGSMKLVGDDAKRMAEWLNEHGYKDKNYDGQLVVVLPEDRRYEDWVMEAIYYYAKWCGIKLNAE